MRKIIKENGIYLLKEKISFNKLTKKWMQMIIESYINFIFKKNNVSFDLKVTTKKRLKGNMIGYIDMVKAINENKYELVIADSSLDSIYESIAHELTHAIQIYKGFLSFTDDMKNIIWKKELFPVKDYEKLQSVKNFKKYKEIPWEKEAYKNQDKLPDAYKKTDELKKLADKDATINFMISNNDDVVRTVTNKTSMIG